MVTMGRSEIDRTSQVVVYSILALFAFTTIFPHIMAIPKENQQMLAQANSTLQNILLVIVAFYFGQSQGNLKKDQTVAAAVDRLPSHAPQPVVVQSGDTIETTTKTEVKDANPTT